MGSARGRSDGRATSGSMRSSAAKAQQFWTVLSDLVHGEVIGLRQDRTRGEL